MPRAVAEDGTQLHWEDRGEGALVVISPHWLGLPATFEPLIDDLSADHRVVRYDARGSGESSRGSTQDLATGATDLHSVIEATGEKGTTVFGVMDGCNRALRAAAERSDLIAEVVGIACFPGTRADLEGTHSLLGSPAVGETLLEMVGTDYRGAMRSVLTSGNEQMSEEELRERVQRQISHSPQEVAVAQLRAFMEDDPRRSAVALGSRLSLLYSPEMARGWFPPIEELVERTVRIVPEANIEVVEDGIVTRPDLAAAVVRRVTAAKASA